MKVYIIKGRQFQARLGESFHWEEKECYLSMKKANQVAKMKTKNSTKHEEYIVKCLDLVDLKEELELVEIEKTVNTI